LRVGRCCVHHGILLKKIIREVAMQSEILFIERSPLNIRRLQLSQSYSAFIVNGAGLWDVI
jgi:hypothetical protein